MRIEVLKRRGKNTTIKSSWDRGWMGMVRSKEGCAMGRGSSKRLFTLSLINKIDDHEVVVSPL